MKFGVGTAAAVVVAAVGISPVARADTTVTVQQICDEVGPGLVPMTVVSSPELTCGDPGYWAKTGTVPGLFIAPPPPISKTMARLHQGSFSTDPANPWADWVIPEGSQPAPPTPDPQIACDNIGPNRSIICNHEIWLDVMKPSRNR